MTRTMVIGIAASLLLVGSAQAISLDGIKDSSAFNNGYEADAVPTASTPSWTGEGIPAIETASSGILRTQCAAGQYRRYFQDEWDAFIASDGPKYTVEMRAHPTTSMTRGIGFGVGLGTTSNSDSRYVSVEVYPNKVTLNGSASIHTGANDDRFHVFRIASNSDGSLYDIWRDNVLIKENAVTASRQWGLRFGDSFGVGSDHYVDYVRWTGGSWAPIPAMSLAIGDGTNWHFMTGGDVQVDWQDSAQGISPTTTAMVHRKRAFYTESAFSDDVTLEFEYNPRYNCDGAGRAGAIIRAEDPNHFYQVYFPWTGQTIKGDNFWVGIAEVDGDEFVRNVALACVPNVPAEVDRWYNVRVETDGSTINTWVDGQHALSVTDENFYDSGLVGLVGQGMYDFRNVAVTGNAIAAPQWDRNATIPDNSFPMDVGNTMPSGCIAPNGDVLIGSSKFLLRSTDKGKTWSKETLPADGYQYYLSISDDGSPMIRTHDDRLIVVRTKLAFIPGSPVPSIMVFESTDSGNTWSDGRFSTVLGNWNEYSGQDHSTIYHYGNIVQTDDGALTMFFSYKDVDTGQYKAFAIRSTNGGQEWSAPIGIDSDPVAKNFTEVTGVAIGNSIMATVRPIDNPTMWQVWSDDSRETWDAASSSTFPGYAASIIRLNSGVILSAHRQPNYSINISRDDGLTWDEGTIISDLVWGMGCMIEVVPNVVMCTYMEEPFDPNSHLQAQFFRVTPDGIVPISPDQIPEPATLSILAISGLALMRRRRA